MSTSQILKDCFDIDSLDDSVRYDAAIELRCEAFIAESGVLGSSEYEEQVRVLVDVVWPEERLLVAHTPLLTERACSASFTSPQGKSSTSAPSASPDASPDVGIVTVGVLNPLDSPKITAVKARFQGPLLERLEEAKTPDTSDGEGGGGADGASDALQKAVEWSSLKRTSLALQNSDDEDGWG